MRRRHPTRREIEAAARLHAPLDLAQPRAEQRTPVHALHPGGCVVPPGPTLTNPTPKGHDMTTKTRSAAVELEKLERERDKARAEEAEAESRARGWDDALRLRVAELTQRRATPGLDGRDLASDPRPAEWTRLAENVLASEIAKPEINPNSRWKLDD